MKRPPGRLSDRNRALVAMHDWRLLTYSELPRSHKDALAAHFTGPHKTDEEVAKILGRSKIGCAEIPTDVFCTQIMNDPDRRTSFVHFEQYHKFYVSKEKKRISVIVDSGEVWPIILRGNRIKADERETIWDGWHRFHTYYARGLKEVPVIWYVRE